MLELQELKDEMLQRIGGNYSSNIITFESIKNGSVIVIGKIEAENSNQRQMIFHSVSSTLTSESQILGRPILSSLFSVSGNGEEDEEPTDPTPVDDSMEKLTTGLAIAGAVFLIIAIAILCINSYRSQKEKEEKEAISKQKILEEERVSTENSLKP